MEMVFNLIVLIVSYLLGSINTSIIVSKILIGDDIRNYGSGNAGATNTLRTVGKKGAALVVLGDVLKTVVAILVAKIISHDPSAVYIAGIGAVIGHNFPVYFNFRGGKGIVVSAVAILFADVVLGIVTVCFALAVMAVSKYVSLGSILGAVLFVIMALIFKTTDTTFVVFAAMLALLAIFMHRTNISRLIKGEESKLSFGSKKNQEAK